MSRGPNVRVEGADEVIAALKRYGEAGRREVSRAVVDSALAIQTGAKRATPVDTGRLRNSVAVAEAPAEMAAASGAATATAEAPNAIRDGMMEAVIGTNVEYAPAVHFGENGRPGRPFLLTPFEQERDRFVARLRRALDDTMREAR